MYQGVINLREAYNSSLNANLNETIRTLTVIVIIALLYNTIFFSKYMAYAHHIIDQIPIPSRPMGLSSDNSQLLYVSNFGLPIVSSF